MKTLMRSLVVGVFAIIAIGCGKKSSSPSNNTYIAPINNSGYYVSNNSCYQRSNNQQVDMTYCNQQTNVGGYYTSNGLCYNSSNQQVDTINCNQNQNTYVPPSGGLMPNIPQQPGTGYGTGQPVYTQCVGYFYDQYGQPGYCNGYNCRGYPMYHAQTMQPVICM